MPRPILRRPSCRVCIVGLLALVGILVGVGLPIQSGAQSGSQWVQSGFLGQDVTQVVVDSTTPGEVYAALPSGDLFHSTNGGQGWSLLYDLFYADPPTIIIDPNNPNTLYASSVGAAFKTIDGGANWVKLDISDISAWAIDPSNSNRVYAGSRWMDRFYRSVNGGATWDEGYLLGGARDIAIDAEGEAIYAAFVDPTTSMPNLEDGVYRSYDNGLSWTKVFTSHLVSTLTVDPNQPGVVYLGTEGEGVFRSGDFGANWQPVNTGLGSLVVRDLLLDSRDPPTLYAGTWEGGVFRSRDEGASWVALNSGLTNLFVLSLALDPGGQGTLYAGTKSGGLYRVNLLPDPPPPTATYAHALDAAGMPLEGALVYHNGMPLLTESDLPATTDLLGNLVVPDARPGDQLVALRLLHEQPTVREAHDDWAYRVYQTSLEVTGDGSLQGSTILETPGPRDLIVRPSNPLVLFNLVVSVEWDADDAYLAQIERAARAASDFLYDVSDGQLAFGRVQIYSGAAHWTAADLQISTNNIVRPHAYVGGITSEDTAHVMRVGRAWDGRSGNGGPWDQPDGFRTLVHEFGHYGLYLYDEYFGYRVDGNGNLLGELPASCTGPANRDATSEATNASIMDYQYTSSELSMRAVAGLWSETCELTAQYLFNGESAWETVARHYADPTAMARWTVRTPAERGGVVGGPAELPDRLLNLPVVIIVRGNTATAPRMLQINGADGVPYRGAIVALYKVGGRVISQGFSDQNGKIAVFGAEAGDLLRVASFDGGLACRVAVSEQGDLSCSLRAVGGSALSASAPIPHLRLIADPSPTAGQVDLLIGLQHFPADSDPYAYINEPGSTISRSPLLVYSPTRDAFEARVGFSATERGSGQLRADRKAGGDRPVLQTSYRLQHIDNPQGGEVFSNDGNLWLYLGPGSLPGAESYVVVMAPGAVPGALPAGMRIIGDPYDITASGAVVELERPAVLAMHYDGALVNGQAPEGLGLYRWDPVNKTWQALAGELDESRRVVTGSIALLGVYALLAPEGTPAEPVTSSLFLPLLIE